MSTPATFPAQAMTAAREALARAIGMTAFIYGYPLVESYRTCRLQTQGEAAPGGANSRAPINRLGHIRRAATHHDRDVVTPANDLLYSTAWIHLADSPQRLSVPAAADHPGRYFVLALYDAQTENFENLGPRNCDARGETVLLVGPGQRIPEGHGLRVVQCPTDLVWLVGRILVGDEADLPAAQALQAAIGLDAFAAGAPARRPAAVEHWMGEPVDTMAAVLEQRRSAAEVAPAFFSNLCQALAELPARPEDRGLLAWLSQAGLVPQMPFDWQALDAPLRAGLAEGLADAVQLLAAIPRGRTAEPWRIAPRVGRYGNDHLARALTAYMGFGALAKDEAVYAAGHFSADGQPLDGTRRYTLRFAADQMPPAEAFWSVTLYDADRCLYASPSGRHAIGDRTSGLRREADGALVIDFAHEAPADARNWLPTPAGRFYLVLRLYHPRDQARGWQVPALQPLPA